MAGEKNRNWISIIALLLSLVMMLVTVGSMLFATRADFMTREETQAQFEKLEQRNGETMAEIAARLARLEQMHGPGGHQ